MQIDQVGMRRARFGEIIGVSQAYRLGLYVSGKARGYDYLESTANNSSVGHKQENDAHHMGFRDPLHILRCFRVRLIYNIRVVEL